MKASEFLKKPWVVIAMLAIVTAVFWANYSACFDKKVDLNGDNLYYYSLGQALSHGNGYTDRFGFEPTAHMHFPPGYPVFIAGLDKLFPDSVLAVKRVNGVLLWLGILLLFMLARRLLGGEVIIPFAASLLASTQPDLLRFSSMMMSESLYFFLTTVILWSALALKDQEDFRNWKFLAYAAILLLGIGYIPFVRSMGTSIVLAVIVWFVCLGAAVLVKALKTGEFSNPVKKKLIFYFAAAVLTLASWLVPKLAWDARNNRLGGPDNTYKSMFTQKQDGGDMTTLADWTKRISTNATRHITMHLPGTMFRRKPWEKKPSATDWTIGIMLLGVFGLGIYRFRRKGWLLLLLYGGATMAVLMLYRESFSDYRYYWALIPLFYVLLSAGVAEAAGLVLKACRTNHSFWAEAIATVAVAWALIPANVSAQTDIRKNAGIRSWGQLAGKAAPGDFAAAAQWCGANLPRDARFLCRKPELFYYFSGGSHSMRFGEASPEKVLEILSANRIDYLFVDTFFPQAYRTLIPAIQKYPQHFRVLGGSGPDEQHSTWVVQYLP